MRKSYWMLVPAIAAPVLLDGCQTWGPTWSEVTGQRYNVTITNRRPAIIDQVDNQGAFPDPRLIKITPGGPPLHVMMLNAEPCKRYYINAQFDTTITQQWTPVIDYVEPIAGCQVPAAKS